MAVAIDVNVKFGRRQQSALPGVPDSLQLAEELLKEKLLRRRA
jgi:hypothetical protein